MSNVPVGKCFSFLMMGDLMVVVAENFIWDFLFKELFCEGNVYELHRCTSQKQKHTTMPIMYP